MSGALVVTRRKNEEIVIGDDIRVIILGTKAGKTRVVIKAPKHVTVHRAEVYDRIKGSSK